MKDCVLEELLLVSYRERAATRVRFHPRTTLLVGQNGTGKSSIIKSIFHTLGADPAITSDPWRAAEVATVLRFRIDGTRITAVRHAGTFALYDADDRLMDSFTRVTDGLGPAVARLFDFGLRLTDRAGRQVTPPPAYLFLPYYIDQDSSWQRPWSGFARLGQLPRWQESLAEYHTGLRPNDYYEAKAAVDRARKRANDGLGKLAALREVEGSVKLEAGGTLFQLDGEAFRDELHELLGESRRLDVDERKYRVQLRDLQSRRSVLDEQRLATMRALQEAGKDLAFATSLQGHAVECPTCGATYVNSFAHRFAIADDEARCRELLVEIGTELSRIDAAIAATEANFDAAMERRIRLRALLSERRGALALGDVIKAEGRAEMRRAFRSELDSLAAEIRAAEVEAEERERELRRFGDADQRRRIVQLYRDRLAEHMRSLDVVPSSAWNTEVVARVSGTGSERPRALLAYFYAVLHTMREYSSSVFCPIVIDSPNQQAQDEINHEGVLRFLFEQRPARAQLVVGLESLRDVPAAVLADAQIVVLPEERRRQVLDTAAFDEIAAIVSPLVVDSFRLSSQE